jgi:hypothetical protein
MEYNKDREIKLTAAKLILPKIEHNNPRWENKLPRIVLGDGTEIVLNEGAMIQLADWRNEYNAKLDMYEYLEYMEEEPEDFLVTPEVFKENYDDILDRYIELRRGDGRNWQDDMEQAISWCVDIDGRAGI